MKRSDVSFKFLENLSCKLSFLSFLQYEKCSNLIICKKKKQKKGENTKLRDLKIMKLNYKYLKFSKIIS